MPPARSRGFGYAQGLQSRQLALSVAMVATAALAALSPARAASDTVVQLEYRATEQSGCVAEDELRRMVVEQLGHDPFRAAGDRRVTITLSRTEAGFQGHIVWTDARGRSLGDRVLSSRSRDCRELAENVAFAVALQLQLVERGAPNEARAGTAGAVQPPKIDDGNHRSGAASDRAVSPAERPLTPGAERPPSPGASQERQERQEGQAGAPDEERPESRIAERPVPPAEAPPTNAGPDSTTRVRLTVGLGPAVGVGMLPHPAGFGRLFVAARFHRFSAELAGDAALSTTLTEPDDSAVVLNARGASVAGCAHLSAASACLLGRLGWLRGRGTGVDLPATSSGRFGEMGLRLAASRELGRFTVSLHADGLVMLSRWNVLLHETVVWRVPRLGGLLGLDVALRFF